MVKSRITTDKPEGVVKKCDESLHYFVLIDRSHTHSHTHILQKERGKVDKDGVTLGLRYCFKHKKIKALYAILLIILKERPITIFDTHTLYMILFCFFFNK